MRHTRLLVGRTGAPRLLGWGGAGHQGEPETGRIALGHPGRCPKIATLTIFVTDDSVSGGNDVIGKRYAEAAYAIDQVGRRCRCGKELVAVFHFDVPTSRDVAATRLRGRARKIIKAGLDAPAHASSSNLGSSLKAAKDTAAAHPVHATTLIVASDFQLFDPNVPDVLSELAAFPGNVHAVVLRSAPPQQLLDDPRVMVTSIDYNSPRGSMAHAVFYSLTTYRPRRRLVGQSAEMGRDSQRSFRG
jgi:hypothetical protein